MQDILDAIDAPVTRIWLKISIVYTQKVLPKSSIKTKSLQRSYMSIAEPEKFKQLKPPESLNLPAGVKIYIS